MFKGDFAHLLRGEERPPPALDPALAAFAPENMSEEEMMEAAILASLQPSPPPQGDANMDGGSDAPEGGEGGAP